MSNFDTAREALEVSANSSGSAMAEHAKWSQSLEARINMLKAAWQGLSQTFMNSDFLRVSIDFITKLISLIDKLIDNFGLLGTVGLGVLGKGAFNYFKNGSKAITDMADAVSDTIKVYDNLSDAMADMSGIADMVYDTVDATDAFTDTVSKTSHVLDDVSDVSLIASNAIDDLGEATVKTTGGFKAFMKTPIGVASAIGVLVAAIGLAVNAYKNYKQAQSEARQETIDASDDFLNAYDSFEQAYIKYNDKTSLTAEEESELETAIQGTVTALDDKSSALQNAVTSSNDYLASLERIKREELKAAESAATSKKDAAELELKEKAIGDFAYTSVTGGSKASVNFGSVVNEEVQKIVKEIGEDYYSVDSGREGFLTTYKLNLPTDSGIDDIVNYYNTLVDIKQKISDANENSEESLIDTDEYKKISSTIDSLSETVETYTDGTYDAAKAQYQLYNGIPKTVDEYLKMRKAILESDDISGLSLETKKSIANTLDSEYSQVFDLSTAEVQARKFVGIFEKYGNDVSYGSNEIGRVETFLNMRTAVNNDECSVGEYMKSYSDIASMTSGWSEEYSNELKLSLGWDTDEVKTQYFSLITDLSKSMGVEGATEFLNNLKASELSAAYNLNLEGRIDWSNANIGDILKQIEEEAKIKEALNFKVDITADTEAIEKLNTALSESASASGLSAESFEALKSRYSELEGYDLNTLFEETANGIKVNRDEVAKLEKEYQNLSESEVDKHLDTLVGEYNRLTAEIDKNSNAAERAQLISEREGYANKIEELATYQAQLEGVTGAYKRWIDAQNAPEDYEGYQAVATSREEVKDEISRGFISNSTKEYIDLLSGEDLVGATIDEYAAAWENLDKKVGSTSYSIHDFFTVNDDGDITATGIDRFFEGMQQDFNGSVAKFNKETGEWQYDFSQENLQKIQDEWGMGIDAIELMLEAASSAGYDVDWDGILDNLDLDTSSFDILVTSAENAQNAFNKLADVEDIDFNFKTDNIEDATTEVDKAKEAFLDFYQNYDGSIELKAEGAENLRLVLSTLLIQKQQLEDSNIAIGIDTSKLDESQADIAAAIQAVENVREKYKNLEIAVSTGQGIEQAKEDLTTAMTELEGLGGEGVDIAAQLVLGEGADAASLQTKVNAAIESVNKDIKFNCKLEETAIGDLNSQILTNFTPEATVKITGIDDALVKEYTSTEKTANGKVKWENDDSLVVDFINTNHKANGKVSWSNDPSKLTLSGWKASGTVTWTSGNNVQVKVVQMADGTANANGTTGRAFARGSWGTKDSGTAIVGELGMETLVRNGNFYTIGDNGAEFIKYQQGDIIFNHKQTEELFKNGKVTSGGGRGKMFANGTAFVGGNYPSSGAAFWESTAVESNFAKKRKDGTSTTFNYNNINVYNNDKKESSKKSTSKKTTTSKTSTKKKNDNKTDSKSKSSSDSKDFEETFDWIETKIARIERAIDRLDKKANATWRSWSTRNEKLTKEIGKVEDELDIQQNAYNKYIEKANSVGLNNNYKKKVQNGTIDIEDIKNEELAEKVKEYQEWYEKALECEDAILELKDTEAELYRQRFDNVSAEYDGILQGYEHTESMLNEYISQAEAKGHIVSKQYYQALINNEKSNISNLRKEQSALIAARDEAVDSGAIKKGSEEWYDMCSEIDSVTQAIEEGNTSLIEYANSIREIDWKVFDTIQERISDVTSEADFLIELMSNDKLFDDNGKLTGQGAATLALHGQSYNTHMYQADDYGKEIDKLNKQISKDPYDEELINRRRELIELQRESILAAEDEKQAIKDLISDGIDIELDALQELIDKKNEELESEKDLYEYSKKVSEQTKNIASLQKQLLSYEGFEDEETKAKVQQLKLELSDAKDELVETEWDRYINQQSAMLDTLYNEYELILNQRLDNVDFLLQQVIDGINMTMGVGGTIDTALGSEGAIASAITNAVVENGSIQSILKTEATTVGATLSTAMNNIWSTGEGSIKSVLDLYGKGFQSKQTTTNTVLGGIKTSIDNMVAALNKEANKNINQNKTTTSAKKDTTGNSVSIGLVGTTSNKTKLVEVLGNGTPEKGDRVTYESGKYYYDSSGKKPLGSKHKGEKVYITNINKKGSYPYHISTGKKLGKGDLGWVKKKQISGYASGKKNFLDDEIAWTQENAKEFIVRPSDGAILTPVAKGDSILNANATRNIWDMANSPAEFIRESLSLSNNIPNNSNIQNSYNQTIENVVFSMPNVQNYNELLSTMQRDKNFEKLILSMSIDRIAGKSSLAKGKVIR